LTEHSPRLAALLLQNGGPSLKGRELKAFMPAPEDQNRFQHVMNQPFDCQGSSSNTRVLHFSLRDGSFQDIRTEMFAIPFKGVDDSLHHLVGMREFSDGPDAELQQEADVAVAHVASEEGSEFPGSEPPAAGCTFTATGRQKRPWSGPPRLGGTPRDTARQELPDDSQSSNSSRYGNSQELWRLQRIHKSHFLTAKNIKNVSLSATLNPGPLTLRRWRHELLRRLLVAVLCEGHR